MNDGNGSNGKKLNVLAVIEKNDRTYWMKVGAAFPNRDGSITLYVDAYPVGTNKLQIREERDWAPRTANGNGTGNGIPAFGVAPHADAAEVES